MWLWLLAGCEVIGPFLYEVRAPTDEVTLSGYIYNGPFPSEDAPTITGKDASITAYDADDGETVLAAGEEIYPDTYPGYWQLTLPPETPYLMRIDGGADAWPALWAGESPPGDGLFPGTAALGDGVRAGVFGWPRDVTDDTFAAIAEQERVDLFDLADGAVVHLWGGPAVPEDIRGDRIYVEDGAGRPATVYAYAVDPESGALVRTNDAPVHHFFAFNLVPGAVLVRFEGDNNDATTLYFTDGGEIVSPWFFEGPE
ncbi:MAG: hypothetical protein H6739_23975 [Alphaproteobacteria bacterium]|nr:hypothetical protein [Alphaproteobacteria bacterium]